MTENPKGSREEVLDVLRLLLRDYEEACADLDKEGRPGDPCLCFDSLPACGYCRARGILNEEVTS